MTNTSPVRNWSLRRCRPMSFHSYCRFPLAVSYAFPTQWRRDGDERSTDVRYSSRSHVETEFTHDRVPVVYFVTGAQISARSLKVTHHALQSALNTGTLSSAYAFPRNPGVSPFLISRIRHGSPRYLEERTEAKTPEATRANVLSRCRHASTQKAADR